MDRIHILLLGFPLFLFCSDLLNLFTPPLKPSSHLPHHQHQADVSRRQSTDHPTTERSFLQSPLIRGAGYGITVDLKFCASCSYRGNAMTMKKMLETSFPGIEVILANYPPPLQKRLLSKIVPIFQVGAIAIVIAGDQIFPRLGFAVPPPWYFSLRSNKFGAIATTWLIGNFMQSFLQSSGAFEVYCNGDLVFSKLMESRFPSEFELRELIRSRLPNSIQEDKAGSIWS